MGLNGRLRRDDPSLNILRWFGRQPRTRSGLLYFRNRRHWRERLGEQILNDAHVDGDSGLGEVCIVPVMQ